MRDATDEVQHLADAETLVLQLDTRASELKVDGFKALVRDVPAEQLSELADDIATPEGILQELAGIPLEGKAAAAVADLESGFGAYTAAIQAFVDAAVADQAGTRARWEDIQSANDLGIDTEAVNADGGAIALGHPVGASGARLVLHQALALKRRGGGTGVVALCGGVGQGDALILKA